MAPSVEIAGATVWVVVGFKLLPWALPRCWPKLPQSLVGLKRLYEHLLPWSRNYQSVVGDVTPA